MKNKKILFLNNASLELPGGTNTYTKDLLKMFDTSNSLLNVIPFDDEKSLIKPDITEISLNKNGSFIKKVLCSRNKMEKIIKEFNPDLIISNIGFWESGLLLKKRTFEKYKIIIPQHGNPNHLLSFLSKKRKIMNLAAKIFKIKQKINLANIIVFSETSKKEIQKTFNNSKYYISNLGGEKKVNNNKRTKDVIFVGRLSKEKNIPFLNDVLLKMPSLKKTIVGSGIGKEHINIGMKNLTHFNSLSHEDTIKEIRKHKVLILTSNYEGYPLVIVEAINNGVSPIVRNTFLEAEEMVGFFGVVVDKEITTLEFAAIIRKNLDVYKNKGDDFKTQTKFSSLETKKRNRIIFNSIIEE